MKQYKLIHNKTKEETICDKITIDSFDYYIKLTNIKSGDLYYSKFHKKVLVCFNENHSKALNLINEDKFNTNKEIDYTFKVIATNNNSIDIPKIIEEVDNIIKNAFYDENGDFKRSTIGADDWANGLKLGYNKTKELSPNTDEDMIGFVELIADSKLHGFSKQLYEAMIRYKVSTTKELLDIWKETYKIETIYYE